MSLPFPRDVGTLSCVLGERRRTKDHHPAGAIFKPSHLEIVTSILFFIVSFISNKPSNVERF